MPKIKRIDHIAIVVEDIDKALDFWRDALGLDLSHVEEVLEQESMVAFLPASESEVELVEPTTDTSGVYRYMQKRGPGMHHICFEVDDIHTMLEQLKEKGVKLIDQEPIIGTGGKKIAFIHPESAHGVLIELYELTGEEKKIRLRRARELAGRVRVRGQVAAAGVMGFLRGLRDGNGDKEEAEEAEVEGDV